MKKVVFLLTVISFSNFLKAQTYAINFTGTGLSTVKVQNLTTGTIVDVPAGDVLLLSGLVSIPEIGNLKSTGLKIYPNPITDMSTLEILPPVEGIAIISVSDITGKVLILFKDHLDNSLQKFSLSGIDIGLHIINVQGNGYQFSEKMLSCGKSNGIPIIVKNSNNIAAVPENRSIFESKGVQGNVSMTYTAGERLKYTAVSGNCKTVMTDIPAADKTVTFTFTECKDGDNNFYPVVQIGTYFWMSENLKTTKYSDGISIPLVSDGEMWNTLSTPGYSWYNNDVNNKVDYGAMYNWYTVNTKKLCPTGWHVPDVYEWYTLARVLDVHAIFFEGIQSEIAGGKMQETGTAHWISPNSAATNETGFTALPGGNRGPNGEYFNLGNIGCWWSSTEEDMESPTKQAYSQYIWCNCSRLLKSLVGKQAGYSVRCLKD